ncbi:uncharacterized protein LOC130548742 isoform X1 [Triplophysa rosa]|uniref:Uncharacterized protein n=1 Tax=Triplophysa rosa TaxID=992332 RepID=A0A9W7X2C8_TRIRA|nr:uncharacterized protein LOC130548742 isoform X1 [Triplophysa rosa]KAI7812661.1 hypothetical protein IRJ41_006692 [Triplophysa rosa]
MELQHSASVSANEYEESEGIQRIDAVRTEDIYQCLQQPSTEAYHKNKTVVSEHYWGKRVFLIGTVNILILTIIVAIVAMSYSLHKETHLLVANGQEAKNEEKWLLYDNVFYLFWSEHSDCSAAIRLCAERDASLVTLTLKNKFWLQSKANGKQFLVLRSSLDGSGDSAPEYLAQDEVPDDDEDNHQCGTMTPETDKDHREGFVCERTTS